MTPYIKKNGECCLVGVTAALYAPALAGNRRCPVTVIKTMNSNSIYDASIGLLHQAIALGITWRNQYMFYVA